jgi:hypothetical protein
MHFKKKIQKCFGRTRQGGKEIQRTGWRAFVFGIIHDMSLGALRSGGHLLSSHVESLSQ